MRIDTLQQWERTARALSDSGYICWQMQYDIDDPHGFIARFMAPDDSLPRVEHVTFDAAVKAAMMRYKP